MIALEEPGLSIEGLTLFRDHADPLQWYFWPDKPRLEVTPDGKPAFGLTKFRKDPATLAPGADAGGGVLNVGIGLLVGADALSSAALAIQRQFDALQVPRLAPIVPRSGSARFVFLDEAPALAGSGALPPVAPPAANGHVERASYVATPSLTAPESVTFSLSLNVAGTLTLEKAMSTGQQSLAGIVYDLVADAVEAPSGFVVSAAWDRVNATLQDRFGGSAGAQPLVTIDEIASAVAQLLATGVVKLTASGGSAATIGDVRAANRLTRFIADSFFMPSLAPPGALAPPDAPSAPAYVFRGVAQDALGALDAEVNSTGPVAAHFTAQARLGELVAPYPAASLVTEVDLSDSFFKTIDVHVVLAGTLEDDQISAVEVWLSYNGQQMTCLLTDGQQSAEARWTFDAAAGNAYSYGYKVLFLEGSPISSATLQSSAATLAIAPRNLYALQTIVVQDVGVPFERYAKVDVELGYGDRPEAFDARGVVSLTPSQRSGNWAVRLANGQKPGYQSRLTYYPIGGAPIVGQWIPGTAPMLPVGDLGAQMDGSQKNVSLLKSGWSDAVTGGWNASERTVAGVRRIPLQGLTLVNQDPAYDPSTIESAAARAILYVPTAVDASKPVEVLFHLHGHNIGYRQRAGKNVPGAGTVRDVEVDKIADQLARSGRPMIAVLVQGSLAPAFGSSGTTGFNVNTTLEEILGAAASAGVWSSPPAIAKVIVSAHGAGGDTVGALLGQAGQPRLPRAMGGLFLFNAIDAPTELASVTSYLTDRLTYDSLNIQNLEPNVPDQLAYLRTSPRLRAFYSLEDGAAATNYATLKQSLTAWFARNADDLGGTESATYAALSANYQIAAPANAGGESLVGEALLQALA